MPNRNSENAKCTCIDNGKISEMCLEKGICPTLTILREHRGVKLTDNGKIRKEFKGFEKGFEGFRKVFEIMRRKK